MLDCPHCGQPLETIQIEKVVIAQYVSGESLSSYEDNGQGSITVRCYKCGKQIGHHDANSGEDGIIPEGIQEII